MRAFQVGLVALALPLAPAVAHAAWSITPIDTGTNAGWFTSLRLGPQLQIADSYGVPHVAYWTPGTGFRYYDGLSPGASAFVPPAASSDAPEQALLIRYGTTALALDNGKPWIAEAMLDADQPNGTTLTVRHMESGTWLGEDLGLTNSEPAIDVDASGDVHVLFPHPAGLTYARRHAGAWSFESIDSAGAAGTVRVAPDGTPCIAYVTYPARLLHFARRTGNAWDDRVVEASGRAGGYALAFDAFGHARIAYLDVVQPGALAYLRYAEEAPGGAWTTSLVTGGGTQPWDYSLAIAPGDRPWIAVRNLDVGALVALEREGGTWSSETVDPTPGAGEHPSIAIDPDYRPVIAYRAYPHGVFLAYGNAITGVGDAPRAPNPFGLRVSGANPLRRGEALALTVTTRAATTVTLEAFDARGRALGPALQRAIPGGSSRVEWPGARGPAGLVFFRATTAEGEVATTRAVRLD